MAMPAALLPTQSEAAKVDDTEREPTSPSYAGPFVPFAVSDPDKAIWKGWYTLLDDYSDARSGSLQAKRDHNNMYRGGGFDLKQYWEMEIRAAIEGLGIDPME
jgi:CDK-activating kinase assembly factor MAT1